MSAMYTATEALEIEAGHTHGHIFITQRVLGYAAVGSLIVTLKKFKLPQE